MLPTAGGLLLRLGFAALAAFSPDLALTLQKHAADRFQVTCLPDPRIRLRGFLLKSEMLSCACCNAV